MSKSSISQVSLVLVVTVLFCMTLGVASASHPEINVWIKAGPEADALEATAQAYYLETGNKVNVVTQGRSGFRGVYQTALLAGSKDLDAVHDVGFVVPSLAAGGMIEPLDSYLAKRDDYNVDDFQSAIQEEMQFEGSWYMLPTDMSVESLVYRTDLIPEPPATWEELRELALQFTKAHNPDSPTEYGYAYSGFPGVLHGTWQGLMYSYGARIVNEDGKVTLDDENAIESFAFLAGLKNADKVTPQDITAWDYPELLVALQEGVVAMADFFSAGMPVLIDPELSPGVYDRVSLAPQPAGPLGSWTRINPLGLMINSASPRKEATFDFVYWLTQPNGAKIYTEHGGSSPRISIMLDPDYAETRPWYAAMYEAGQQGAISIRHSRATLINETFNKWASQVISGVMSAEDAFNRAAAELRRTIR